MGEQLIGVLRQVRAIDGKDPRPAPSLLFSGELGNGAVASTLAEPARAGDRPLRSGGQRAGDGGHLGPRADPCHAGVDAAHSRGGVPAGSIVHRGRALSPRPKRELDSPEARGGGWRSAWWRGVLHLAAGRPTEAESYFAAVISELPGELAPRLALAVSLEMSAGIPAPTGWTNGGLSGPTGAAYVDDIRQAADHFEIVAATDPELRQCQLRPGPGPGGARRPSRGRRSPPANTRRLKLARRRPDRPLRPVVRRLRRPVTRVERSARRRSPPRSPDGRAGGAAGPDAGSPAPDTASAGPRRRHGRSRRGGGRGSA